MQDKDLISKRQYSMENIMTIYNSQVLVKTRSVNGVTIVSG